MADDRDGPPEEAIDSAALDAIFRVLSDGRRRVAIRFLQAADEPVDIADLAREIATRQVGMADGELPDDALRQIEIALHHVHLPKLSGVDAVAFDTVRNTIAPGEGFEPVARVLWMADEALFLR